MTVILFLVAMLYGPLPADGATSLSDQQAMVGVLFEYNFAGDAPFYAVSQLPPGLTFDSATRTFTGIPTGVGAYLVDVVGSDGTSAETNSLTLSVEPGIATITLTGTNQAYDGTPKAVTIATTPANLSVTTTYNGIEAAPINAGTYDVTVTIKDSNYVGSVTATLVLAKAPAWVTLSSLLQAGDGGPKSVSAATAPAGLTVALSYNGSLNAPTNVGIYTVIATVADANFAGCVTNLMAIAPGGAQIAWGYGGNGELGVGSNSISLYPVAVLTNGVMSGKSPAMVAAGQSFSVCLALDGSISASGYNGRGQLGNNSMLNSFAPVSVVATGVLAGHTIVSLAAGSGHCLALSSDGRVFSWGENDYGQLGNGLTNDISVPVAVDASGVLAGKFIIAIAAGGYHSLALTSEGEVVAWGSNGAGQLGNNSTNNSLIPVLVNSSGVLAGRKVVAIAAGQNHSVAITLDGRVHGWGFNLYGQLGNNSGLNSPVPVSASVTGVLQGKSIRAVAGGLYHTLALTDDGQLYSWGGNYNGQLGNNTTSESHAPVAVVANGALAGRTIISIGAGYAHCVALSADRRAFTWGRNQYGQLGDGTSNEAHVPRAVFTGGALFNKRVTVLVSGTMASHTLALAVPSPNVAPATFDQTIMMLEDTVTNLTLTGADANGDPLLYAIVETPAHGSVGNLNPATGVVTYTPANHYFGVDRLTFTVSDGFLVSTGVVNFAIAHVNHAPIVNVPIPVQNARYGSAFDSWFDDDVFFDVDGDELGYSASGLPPGLSFDSATHTVSGTPLAAGDYAVVVIASDGGTPVLSATNVVQFHVAPISLAVGADMQSKVYGAIDPALTCHFLEGELLSGDGLSGSLTRAPGEGVGEYAIGQGTLSAGPNYAISYTGAVLRIDPGQTELRLSSSTNSCQPGETVVFSASVSVASPASGSPGGFVRFFTNGSACGGPVPLTGGTAAVSAVLQSHGSNTVTAEYPGDANFHGSTNDLRPAQVVNRPPTARNHTLGAVQNKSVQLAAAKLALQDLDADGDSLTIRAVSTASAAGGTLALTDGLITYVPPSDYAGPDMFTYEVADSFGGSTTGTVSVTVKAIDASGALSIANVVRQPDGSIHIRASGIPGSNYVVQASSDLAAWTNLGSAAADANGRIAFSDADAIRHATRYYRMAAP